MKSNIFALPILVSSYLFLVTPALAQTITPTTSPKPGLYRELSENRREDRKELKDIRQETNENKKEIRKDLRASVTGTGKPDKTELHRQILSNSQQGLYRSFTVRFSNLEKYQKMIADRITRRLVKLPGNTSLLAAQTRLTSADMVALKKSYSDDLAKFQATIATIKTSSDPKSLMSELKSEAKKLNTDLKAIRHYLVETLRLVVKAK